MRCARKLGLVRAQLSALDAIQRFGTPRPPPGRDLHLKGTSLRFPRFLKSPRFTSAGRSAEARTQIVASSRLCSLRQQQQGP